MSESFKAHLALITVALIYGANYSITKVVVDDNYMMPINLVMFRVITGALLFNIFHQAFIKEKVAKADYARLFICAMTGVAINQSFFIVGLKYTTPINASLIMTTTPILVLIASAIILKERITHLKIGGILLGITGAVTLILLKNGSLDWNLESLKGDLMILINAVSYGIYLVLVKSLMKKYHPITVVKWVFSIGLVLMLPFGISGIETIDWASFPTEVWASFVFILLATTFLAYLLNAFALKLVNPSVVSVYIYLQPVVATIIALLWGKDSLTLEKLAAGALIFVGVYLVSRQKAS